LLQQLERSSEQRFRIGDVLDDIPQSDHIKSSARKRRVFELPGENIVESQLVASELDSITRDLAAVGGPSFSAGGVSYEISEPATDIENFSASALEENLREAVVHFAVRVIPPGLILVLDRACAPELVVVLIGVER